MRNEEIITEDGCELLKENQATMFRMKGNSMYPLFKDGDTGIVYKCKIDDLSIGDIVVFKSKNKYLAHRLIEIKRNENENQYIAQGDKNIYTDKPFNASELSGIITTYSHKAKIKSLKSTSANWQKFMIMHFRLFLVPFYNLLLRLNSLKSRISLNIISFRQNIEIIGKGTNKLFFQNAALSVMQGILPFLLIICMKLLIDVLTDPHANNIKIFDNQQFLLISTALIFLFNALIIPLKNFQFELLSHAVTHKAFELLHKKHSILELQSYEDPLQQDKIYRAVNEAGFRPAKILGELLTLVKSLTSVIVMVTLFASIKWYLVLLLLIAIIPSVFVRLKYSVKKYRLKKCQSTREREMSYYNRILTGAPYAKETRLFGFSNIFLNRFLNIESELFKERIKLKGLEFWADVFSQIFAVLLIFTSLAYIVYLKTIGIVSLGSIVLFFFVFQRGFTVLTELFRSLTSIVEDNTFLSDFTSFLNESSMSEKTENISQPFPFNNSITIENLSFSYPNSKRNALKSVNISIPYGKKVAFVGANGSGKSTLVKLLCGFYTPNEGRIMFDDINYLNIKKDLLREQITVVFQDFALYNITAQENIGLGDIKKPLDIEKAKKAAKAAGISELLENLPQRYKTLLGNLFKNGEELSIGQWQKIAIARALYRDTPIIFMDEPSSALDFEAEKQLLDTLKEMGNKKTMVIISHRLSTVEWADIIYVFDKGQIIESGSHKELINMKGIYYQMFLSSGKKI